MRQRTAARSAAIALALSLGFALAGCAPGPDAGPPPGASQSGPGASEPNSPQDQSTAAIPAGWPDAISVVPGPIVEGANIDDTMWIVTVAVNGDGRAIFDEGVALLESAGHSMVFLLDDNDDNLTGQWQGSGYFVLFEVSHTDGTKYANYTVIVDS